MCGYVADSKYLDSLVFKYKCSSFSRNRARSCAECHVLEVQIFIFKDQIDENTRGIEEFRVWKLALFLRYCRVSLNYVLDR